MLFKYYAIGVSFLLSGHRKHKLHSSMSASKRKEVMRFKVQVEQQIEALNKQIASEKRALLFARANNLRKSVW